MIKRSLFMVLLAISSISLGAQEVPATTSSNTEDAKETFSPYWFIQAQGGASYTVGEAKFKNLISPAGALSVGRQFSPILGTRLNISGWQSKGGWTKPDVNYKFNYVAANVDLLVNIFNIFGYSDRAIDLYAFGGIGANYAFNNDEAQDLKATRPFEYLWDGSKTSFVGRGGLIAEWNISSKWAINLEGNVNVVTDKYNSKNGGHPDFYYNAVAGVTYKFGRKAKVQPIVVATPVVEAQPVEKKEEVKPIEPAPVAKVEAKKVEPYQTDIFFQLNKSVISSDEEKKIEELAKYMRQNPDVNATITGYADVKTGNATYNLKLSQERTQAVAKMLVEKYNIASNRVKTDYKGDKEQPYKENEKNRVCIGIAK